MSTEVGAKDCPFGRTDALGTQQPNNDYDASDCDQISESITIIVPHDSR